MRRKYKLRLGLLILGLILSISGITYAYLRQEKTQDDKNAVSTIKCLNVTFADEKDIINLKDAFAITDEIALQTIKPYKFTLRNSCPNNVSAEINLESLLVQNQLNKRFLKVYFKSEDMNEPLISILDSLPDREAITENATSDNLTTIDIKGYGEKEFELKLWVDYDTTAEDGMNKYYEGKIAIKASPNQDALAVYGVRRDIDSESSSWERIGLSTNLVANAQFGDTPVQNDFDNIYPWSDIISYNYKYNSSTGTVTETMYGDANFKFDGTNGEVLTRIPEFYYNRYQQTEDDGKTYEYILISPEYIDGYYKSEAFSVGRYTISGAANNVHSKSGVQPFTNATIDNFRNYIRNTSTLGNDFGQMDYHYFILQLLYLVEYADYNSQGKIGRGYVNCSKNNYSYIQSGGCNNLGMKSGTLDENNTGTYSVIYRGIEDIYGNIFQFVDGINIKDLVAYVCYDQNNYQSDIFSGCYQPVGYTIRENESKDWVKKLGYDQKKPIISYPIDLDSDDVKQGLGDRFYSSLGQKITLIGGSCSHGSSAGLWYWNLGENSSVVSSSPNAFYIGARLLRYN